jgi:hypothetical protein
LQSDAVQKLKLDAVRCEFWQISGSHFTPGVLSFKKNHSDATGDFKYQRGVGVPVPYFGPNRPFKAIPVNLKIVFVRTSL